MGNRATITYHPKRKANVCVYVHWNGSRESIEGFCMAAKELGYRCPATDPAYGMGRLAQIIGMFFGGSASIGVGTVKELEYAGDDNGCWVIGDDWRIIEDGTNPDPLKSEYIRDCILEKVRACDNAHEIYVAAGDLLDGLGTTAPIMSDKVKALRGAVDARPRQG